MTKDVAGDYVVDGYPESEMNDWHYVTISVDDAERGIYTWNNRAGVEWTLKQAWELGLEVAPDCPYYDDGHREAFVDMDWDGNIIAIHGPWNEVYLKQTVDEDTECVDSHWLNGHGHTCADIATDPWAQGDWTDTTGMRADEACCHFGGGLIVPKVSEDMECEDLVWLNDHGHTCQDIATDQWAQGDWTDSNGVRADEACCHFGGGAFVPKTPEPEETECEDKPWLNGHGHTCADISTDPWAQGDWTDTNGVRADEACCKFGGGDKGCQDKHWLNDHGHTCEEIAADPWAQGDWIDRNGVRADDACCHFGGGDKGDDSADDA